MSPKRREFVFKSLFRKRVQAVLTDPEDVFGNPAYMGAAELAVRLGAINNFERRGNVVWMDDFESPVLRWRISTTGAGASVALSTAQSLSGIQSVKLTAGTGASHWAQIWRHVGRPRSTRVGFEIAFTTHVEMDYVDIMSSIYDGTNYIQGYIRADYDDGKIYYNNSGGSWVDTGLNPQFQNRDFLFRRLKFVYDYGTSKWDRVFFDNEEVDLSGIAMKTGASALLKEMYLNVFLTGDGVHNAYIYVDNVIITQNE